MMLIVSGDRDDNDFEIWDCDFNIRLAYFVLTTIVTNYSKIVYRCDIRVYCVHFLFSFQMILDRCRVASGPDRKDNDFHVNN